MFDFLFYLKKKTFLLFAEKELLAEVDSEFIVKLYRTFQVHADHLTLSPQTEISSCVVIL